MVGAWYELDLTSLWHHLNSLGTLNLRHHLVLDVGRGRGVGAGRALLDGEHNGTARGRGAQAGRELNHIALGWQETQVFGRSRGDWSWLNGEEPARLRLCWRRGDRSLSSRRADFTAGGSQEGQGRRLGVLQGETQSNSSDTNHTVCTKASLRGKLKKKPGWHNQVVLVVFNVNCDKIVSVVPWCVLEYWSLLVYNEWRITTLLTKSSDVDAYWNTVMWPDLNNFECFPKWHKKNDEKLKHLLNGYNDKAARNHLEQANSLKKLKFSYNSAFRHLKLTVFQ